MNLCRTLCAPGPSFIVFSPEEQWVRMSYTIEPDTILLILDFFYRESEGLPELLVLSPHGICVIFSEHIETLP